MNRILAVCIMTVALSATLFAGNIPEFETSSQKQFLQRSLQSALERTTKEAFMADAKRAATTAYMLWEKEALAAYEDELNKGKVGLEEELSLLKSKASMTIQMMVQEAEGAFDARCAEIVMLQYAKEELVSRIQQMAAGNPLEDIAATYRAWDEEVGDYVEELLTGIGLSLAQQREVYIMEIQDEVEAYRQGFIKSIDERIAALQKEAKRDMELYFIGAQNKYIWEHFSDTDSLRRQSELQSAEKITAQVLQETQSKAETLYAAVEEKLAYSVEGIGVAPEGDDIEALVRAGMYAWKQAEDRLIAARITWEKSALETYDETDKTWAEAYKTLEQKRSEWITAIQQQIRQGIISWNNSFLETDRSYADALKLLDETIAAEKERFDDYSASVRELITTGSGSLRVAYENIAWLKEYFTTLTGIEYTSDAAKKAYIESYLQNDTTETKALKRAIYDQIVEWEGIRTRYQEIVAGMALQYHTQDMVGSTVTQFIAGDFTKQYVGEEKEFFNTMHIFRKYFDEYTAGSITDIDSVDAFELEDGLSKYVVGIQMLHYLGQQSTLVSFDTVAKHLTQLQQYQGKSEQIESVRDLLFILYEAYIHGDITYNGQHLSCNNPGSGGWVVSRLDAFNRYVREHPGSFENVFGYKEIVTRTSGLLSDDSVDENGNPLYNYYLYKDTDGVVIIDGLYELTGDPYLMTAVEFDLEKEKLTLAYWEERLRRAQKLYDFAYNEAERPDAQTQKANLEQALAAYEKAKKDYNDAMALLSGELKDALVSAQKGVDSAQQNLVQVRTSYEAAQKAYQEAMDRCLYYTNPDAMEMAIQMINEATRNVVLYTNRIEEKERKWITAKKNYYSALLLQERNQEAATYAKRVDLAIKALEGYSTEEREVAGMRMVYSTWQDIAGKSLDEAIEAIEENEELLFIKIDDMFSEYANDERLLYLIQAFEQRDVAKEKYEQAKERYEAWATIVTIDNNKQKVKEAIVYKLNEVVGHETPLTTAILDEQIEILANTGSSLDEKNNAIALIVQYTGGLVQAEKLVELREEVNPDIVRTRAMEIIAGSILKKVYGRDASIQQNGIPEYPDWDSISTLYEEVIRQEYNQSTVGMVYAVNSLGKAIEDAYQISRMVVVYLLHDMNGEEPETSEFAKDNIVKKAEDTFNAAQVAYYQKNKESLQTLIGILQNKKEELTNEGSVNWDGFANLYNELIDECMQQIHDGSAGNALNHGYLYSLITTMADTLKIQDNVTYDSVIQQLSRYMNDIETVIEFYNEEISNCTTNDEIDALLKKYSEMLEKGVDADGDALSYETRHLLEVKVTALVQPEVFDFVQPVVCEGAQSAAVMQIYARYVEQFYDQSQEKMIRTRKEGFIGKIATLLGIGENEAQSVFKGRLTVGDALEYGKKIETFIQTKEYGNLPQAIKEALQQVVSAYHEILTQKAKYEHRYSTAEDTLAQYKEKTNIYNKLIELQEKYGELMALRSLVYSDEENEYDALQQSYQQVQPNGTWPGFTDALISKLNECESLYNEIKDLIDSTQFKDLQTQVFALLVQVEKVRKEYEIVDYVSRYLFEGEMYGSVEDYIASMRSHGKDEAFIQAVMTRINSELKRRQDIDALMDNGVSVKEVQQEWGHDNTWILAAYYEGIRSRVGDETFNALLYDEGYREYALLRHFQSYVGGYIQDNGYTSFENIAGKIDAGGQYVRGSFANLAQYRQDDEISRYIVMHYDELKQLYYGTLVEIYAPSALSINNVNTYKASSDDEMYTHFIAYMLSTGSEDISFEDLFGSKTDESFVPAGFSNLVQYGDMQDYFATHYDVFSAIYNAMTHERVLFEYSYLPDGVREYAIVSDYYGSVRNGIYSDGDPETLLARYGIASNENNDNYEQLKTTVNRFMDVMDIALEYEEHKDASIQEYIERYNITDEKEKNFLILYSINPDLADPVNLIVTDNKVPLALTGYQMEMNTWEVFDKISNDSDDGLQNLLAMCIYAANRDSVTAQAVYQFVLAQRETYNHWRNFADIMEKYYNDYSRDENSLSPLKELIVSEKNLKKVQNVSQDTKVDYTYYEDSNNNDQYDPGEKYLANYIQEYKEKGLAFESKQLTGVEDITRVKSDDLNGNTRSYYTGTDSSYYNEMIDKATYMAEALDMLVEVAHMATEATDTFVLYDEDENQIDISFIHDVDMLIGGLQATGYNGDITLTGSESEEEGSDTEPPVTQALKVIKMYMEAGQDTRVQELVDSMKETDAQVQNALLKSYEDIRKMGLILSSGDLQEYLKSHDYNKAQEVYRTNKALFEQAQADVNKALQAYQQAQDAYTKQLEIITILYNRLEEARKLKEDEEMLYAYASTPYLYNSLTNAEGGDPEDLESKLKADAKQQYELAQQYRNEVKQKIAELQQKVEAVKQQKVENDQQYVKLKKELIERAERAYRMEKAAWCMKNEIKKLTVAYEELKGQYEAKKDAFIAATGDDYTDERDQLIDRMIQNNYLTGEKTVKKKNIGNDAVVLIEKALMLSSASASMMPKGVSEAVIAKLVYDFVKEYKNRTVTINSMMYHLQQSAFYYDRHAGQFGGSSKINTDPWFGDIPSGSGINRTDSPMYEYLQLLKEGKIAQNAYIGAYYSNFLAARDGEYEYDNLNIVYAGYYEVFKPILKEYKRLRNTYKKVFGKKIYYLRPLSYILRPVVYVFEKAFNFIFKKIREAEQKWKNNDRNAMIQFYTIQSKLNELQSLKIKMLQAKAKLACYTEIESLDDPEKAGKFVYYNPRSMQNVVVQKPTLKKALKDVAEKYGMELKDSDLALMAEEDRGGDWVNVNNYRTAAQKTDENGYTTDETMQVLHAGTVGQTYANIMNQQKRDVFARYMAHVQALYTQGGFDRVVVDRAVEKDLYNIWAGDSSDYQSALTIGAESKGTIRAMLAYMGYVEGMPADVINQLDAMIGTDNEQQVEELFAQYVKQYEGINDRELAQRRALQVHEWQLKKKLLADKKADWDRMVSRIFQRGMNQWDVMLKSFENRWKNWQREMVDAMVKGSAQWDARMKKLQEEKIGWLVAAQSGAGYNELKKRMAGIEVVLNDMLESMKKEYGDVVKRVDVHALLVDILREQPQLLNEEIMKLTKQKTEFGLTQLSYRNYNRGIFDQAQKLAEDFARAQEKTGNLALLKALTELLKQCRQQIEQANEQACIQALQFVSGYNFGMDGNRYTRRLAVSDKEQKIPAYRPFVFTDNLLLGTYTLPGLMDLYNDDDGVEFAANMNVVLDQVQTRMGMIMRPDIPWGFGYYVGEFGEIAPGPTLKRKGKGEFGRITKEVYNAEKEKATEDAICQYVDAGIAVTLSIATANPMVGAVYMSWNQFSQVATGDLSLQHWAVQTGISVTASYAGGYVGGATNSAVYGSLATSAIQGLGNFVEYKQDGGLGLQWGSKQQWRSFGIGASTALVGAKLGQMYGDSWNNSWLQYGYTASSSYVVNRFDGTGTWQDDLLQSGASLAALWASNELLTQGTVLGNVASNTNAIAPMNRFIQGTLENIILAGVQVGQGKSIYDALLEQNWAKTQYTMADYLSDWASKIAQEHSEATRKMMEMEKKEGLLGLAWLGLRRAGSLLGSAWDEVNEFAKSLFISKDTTNTIETLSNIKKYEIVMTDSGYARKYANGRYEYIDDVAAQAEMYKNTYGGEVVLAAYQGNTGFNPDKIQEIRELQGDGSYKVTVYDKEGKIAQQYYEVKKLDTSKALSYEQAYRLTGGDMSLDKVDIVRNIFITEAKQLSALYSNDLNKQFIAVKDYLYENMLDIYKAYNNVGIYDEDVMGQVIATVAETLLETTTIKYGDKSGNFNYYDAELDKANKSTYYMDDWDWGNPKDPLAAYMGNGGQPRLDCAAFVGLVLDIAGIVDGTKGRDYNNYKGLNLIGKYNGVRNIVDSGLFKEVQSGHVKVGDIAYTEDYAHILIVSKIDNNQIKYIHSSPYDYNYDPINKITRKSYVGVQLSNFWYKYNLKFIRYK